ncbi:YopX family protein [Vibrio barjaei]|uniref:YopX family protein n=1 Tax=Vibrio barjaei TaxID=1676683 RepID=UPI0022844BA0|nr:YopX family protein [Vibrio barjaei]
MNNGDLRQETVSQFTCIRDINDNDIYEHDVLDIEGFLTKVTFAGGALSVDVRGKSYDYTAVGWTEEAMKIVGNTHTDRP